MTSQEEETLLYLNSRNSSLNPEGDFYFNIKPIENVTHLEIVNYQIGWFMQTISEINDTIIIKIFPNNITLEPIILEHGIYDTTRLITELNLKCNITTSSGVKKYPWTFSFYMNKENTLKIKLEGQYKATFINSLTTAKHILGMGSEYDIIIDNLPIPSSEYIFPNQISSIQINDLNNIIDLNITIVTAINPTDSFNK